MDGQRIDHPDEAWAYQVEGAEKLVPPREYRHTLGTIINGLIDNGFQIDHLGDYERIDPNAEPGSWEHFTSVAPPWFHLWTSRQSE